MDGITNKVTEWIDKGISWIDTLMATFLGTYNKSYSKYVVLGALLLIASKIFKVKLNLGGK